MPKETLATKVSLALLVHQDLLAQKDKTAHLEKLDHKDLKESLAWMVQLDQLEFLALLGQKETVGHLVHKALQVRGFQVSPVPLDPQGKKVPQDQQDRRVNPALLDPQGHQGNQVCLLRWLACSHRWAQVSTA